MKIIRETTKFELNEGNLQARGLFNVSSKPDAEQLSHWFDGELKDKLLALNDNEFNEKCEELSTKETTLS